jgi:hypothetical protein
VDELRVKGTPTGTPDGIYELAAAAHIAAVVAKYGPPVWVGDGVAESAAFRAAVDVAFAAGRRAAATCRPVTDSEEREDDKWYAEGGAE